MKICAIICEYNPFHNGHAYQIEQTKKIYGATHIISIMSGNFLQRGDIATFSKHTRAHAALLNGADLVIELPVPFALSSAETFAYGGCYIANALGCVDLLSFGSESGNINSITKAAVAVSDSDTLELTKQYLKTGISFATARQMAVESLYSSEVAKALATPNDTLGIEYIKALLKQNSNITPVCITRHGNEHDSLNSSDQFASATLIRKAIANKDFSIFNKFTPASSESIYLEELAKGRISNIHNLERAILYKLRTMNVDDFLKIADVSEGLENRLVSAASKAKNIDEFLLLAKSKRYALSRLRRILFNAFLNITSDTISNPPPYARVLGFNKRGAEILKKAKSTTNIPISSRLIDLKNIDKHCRSFADIEAKSTDIYNLSFAVPIESNTDYTTNPIIIK